VNNAQIKPQVYKDERPAEHFDRFHRRVREHRPNWDYELVRTILTPYLLGFFRTRAYDTYNVPPDGPCILAPNHFSFLDHFFLAVYLRRKVHFMAKSQLFKLPLWPFFNYGGVFPVRRGHHDDEAFITARAILDRGDIVVMYLEGGRSRTADLGTPRPGVGKLALETGVPVVPVAIAGSEKTRNWKRGQFPKINVRFGEPVRFDALPEEPTRDQAQWASEQVFERIRTMWNELRDFRR
jgi:1-acyl-sn-glycerol-3-phosphate acyltransferase